MVSRSRPRTPAGQVFTAAGPQDFVEPRALETGEIAGIVQQYADGARLAVEVGGFDGVEVHGANGYLPHQCLAGGTNGVVDVVAVGAAVEAALVRRVERRVELRPLHEVGVRWTTWQRDLRDAG